MRALKESDSLVNDIVAVAAHQTQQVAILQEQLQEIRGYCILGEARSAAAGKDLVFARIEKIAARVLLLTRGAL